MSQKWLKVFHDSYVKFNAILVNLSLMYLQIVNLLKRFLHIFTVVTLYRVKLGIFDVFIILAR